MKVWKISTNLTVEMNDNIHNIFSIEDALAITEMDDSGEVFAWDDEENGFMIPYLICDESIVDQLIKICENYDITFEPTDITEDFLMGMYDIPDSDFTDYLEENLTEDIVYAKIKRLGVNSLTDLDKRILEYSV